MSSTIDYYDNNADAFSADTLNVVFSEVQDRFLSYLPEHGMILDFGCGSGRDTMYFFSKGYEVEAVDGSERLCEIARKNTGAVVKNKLFSELDEKEKYDGIWACASILHLSKNELKTVFESMIKAVKVRGYIYASFKYGKYEGYRNGRYFTDFTKETFNEYIMGLQSISIIDEWESLDVRPDRGNEKWLNVILQRSDTV